MITISSCSKICECLLVTLTSLLNIEDYDTVDLDGWDILYLLESISYMYHVINVGLVSLKRDQSKLQKRLKYKEDTICICTLKNLEVNWYRSSEDWPKIEDNKVNVPSCNALTSLKGGNKLRLNDQIDVKSCWKRTWYKTRTLSFTFLGCKVNNERWSQIVLVLLAC